MPFFLMAHSGVRYLVLLLGLLALVQAGVAVARGQPYDRTGRAMMSAFVGVLDLQLLLGVITVFTRPFFPALIGHIAMMVVAVAFAHFASVRTRRREPATAYRFQAVAVLIVLVLIVGGILAIGRPIVGSGFTGAAVPGAG